MTDPSDRNTHSPVFAAWGRIVVRYRFVALAATLALSGVFAYITATQLRIDTSVEAFLDTDSDTFDVLRDLRDDFGVDAVMLVVIEGDVFSEGYLAKLRALHEDLARIDIEVKSLGYRPLRKDQPAKAKAPETAADNAGFGDFGDDTGWGDEAGGTIIDEITSLVNARETVWADGGLQVRGLMDTWPTAAELPALKTRVLASKSLVGQVVDPIGRHATIVLRSAFMDQSDQRRLHDEVTRIVGKHKSAGFEGLVGGAPALQGALNSLITSDLLRLGGLGLLLMFVIMTISFRHPIGIFAPVLVVVQGVIWTFGAMALADVPLTMLSNILPMFIVCVGIGDSVHIQSIYRDNRKRGVDNDEAIVAALASTGMPVLFTTLTTCVGLLSFRLASVDAIQQMGTFGAMGVFAAFVHSMIFLPAALTFNRKGLLGLRDVQDRDMLDRMLDFCSNLSAPRLRDGHVSQRGRNATLLVAVAVVALAAVGISTLRVYHDPVSWIPDKFEIKRAFTALDEHMGGSADLAILIDARDGATVRDRELVLGLEKLEAHIKAYQHPSEPHMVGQIVSVLDVIRESNRATHENAEQYYRLPDTQRGITDMLTMFENAGPSELKRLVTVDLKRTIMIVRVKWMEAGAYAPLVAHIEAGIDEYLGDSYVARPTGSVLSLLTIVGGLITDLMKSFGMAFVFISIMMVVLLRDIRLGLLAMLPNLLPIAAVMGIMGFADIPIDMNNLLLASIALGIAVDDSIHFLHQFQAHHKAHGDVEAAIAHTFSHAGRAIVTTSVILVSGFCIFIAAEMTNLMRFGLLVALTLLLAVIVDLIFTPALLRAVYGVARPADKPKGAPLAEELTARA